MNIKHLDELKQGQEILYGDKPAKFVSQYGDKYLIEVIEDGQIKALNTASALGTLVLKQKESYYMWAYAFRENEALTYSAEFLNNRFEDSRGLIDDDVKKASFKVKLDHIKVEF